MAIKPDLTIILQTFERPDYLKVCIESIFENVIGTIGLRCELIVADDGSKDNTSSIAMDAGADHFITNTHKDEGKGPGFIMNKANDMALADIILHIEDDFICIDPITGKDMSIICLMIAKFDIDLIRLRRILGDNGENRRLMEYFNADLMSWSPNHGYPFQFRTFKAYADGGPSYQYTGNPHFRRKDLVGRIGRYPEDRGIRSLENHMISLATRIGIKTGRFLKGWFTHIGVESTIKNPRAFGEEG